MKVRKRLYVIWMTQDSREPNCATVYLSMPPSCADGWKSSRCTRGGVGAGSSLLVKRSHEQRDARVYFIPYFSKSRVFEIRADLRTPYFNSDLIALFSFLFPKRDSVTETGLLVQVLDLYRHLQSGKSEPRTQPSGSSCILPGQAIAAERLSLHAGMLRISECLYKSRNAHEEAAFCHHSGAGLFPSDPGGRRQ